MAGSNITQYDWLVQSVLSDDGDDSCKEWPHVRLPKGYGTVNIKLGANTWRTSRVHVAAYAIAHNIPVPLPKGVVVRHSCDNPPCFRLKHLLTGSQQDNINDAVAKNRHTIGKRNGMVKLTEEDVREIHSLYSTRLFCQQELADRFGVSYVAISDAITGRRWGHLNLPRLPRMRINRH